MSTPAPDDTEALLREIEALLREIEAQLEAYVQNELDAVGEEFAEAVDDATELVAAAFSVSAIRDMWRRRVPGLMSRLRAVVRRGAADTAVALDAPEPAAGELDTAVAVYSEATRPLVDAVGDHLAEAASRSLAEGVNAGESLDQLKARLLTLFAPDGPQLGPVRAQMIAATEATRAFNAGVLAAAEAIEGGERPLVKQWLTRRDARVREQHAEANGQIRLLADPFDVGGFEMMYPGDPTAPADLTVNCRCLMRATAPPQPDERMASVNEIVATGTYTGAMVALVPSEADAKRLGAYATEDADQLHVTLAFLGDASEWSEADRDTVRNAVSLAAEWISPIRARLFGVGHWNGDGDSPCWVWNVGDDADAQQPYSDQLRSAWLETTYALNDHCPSMVPVQHSPWAPHMTIGYGADAVGHPGDLSTSLGPVVFDRIRVAFAGEYLDIPLREDDEAPAEPMPEAVATPFATTAAWSTPDGTALAFENQQTGDGRVFAPGALYWDGDGPWPLMANDNFDSHDNAALAGSITGMGRDGGRLTGSGVLYLTQDVGAQAAMLLAQGAPLGVSVDLDDVDLEMTVADDVAAEALSARLLRASLLPMPDGGYVLAGETPPVMMASGSSLMYESQRVRFHVGPDGRLPAGAFEISAAAGDPDTAGVVVDAQRSGDLLLRITRARVRGATLVNVPAFASARIVLDDPSRFLVPEPTEVSASASSDYDRVLRHVRRSKSPSGPARIAQFLKIPIVAAQRHLSRAAGRGEVVRLTRGLYTDHTSFGRADHVVRDQPLDGPPGDASVTASVTGSVDLPVAGRDRAWDGDAAEARVFEWADGDCDKLDRAFAWRDPDADCATRVAHKLGFADVIDGELTIVPRGVFAAQAAVEGARGGVDIPADELDDVRDRLAAVRAHVDEETGSDAMNDMQASAWAALADLPPMPAAWFREPTAEELPPGGPGVNYSNGRIFGWVAQSNEPHAGYAKRIVINELGKIDTTHFLRQRFTLDDGSVVKAGAFTMNAGHHRDGAECETAACQFDDTRTVAGIITVGMNERGMWFSGAAAPWMSEWDRSVFMATQPSYHLKQGAGGSWQLRAVLSVPVPGHSSPLLASAVVERSNLALTAASLVVETDAAVAAEQSRQAAETAAVSAIEPGLAEMVAAAVEAALDAREARRAAEAAELSALLAEADRLDLGNLATRTEGD